MSQQPNRPSAEQMAKFKKNANDSSLSAEVRAKFKAIVDKFENVTEEVGEDVVKEVEPAKKRGRKPRATSTTKTTKTTNTTKTKQSPSDVEKAKAEIKAKTGKTEEECEAIIEQYRALRSKAQEGKRKAEQASAKNKNRVDKLENKGDLIEGTNVKTADAVIESTAKDVAEKIEQQIEAVEEKAEKEAKAEVAKDNTIKTPKAKKEAVQEKVDDKVKKETKVVVERVVIDTSALLTSIATSLGKFDKDSQKEFLIKLRSDIDKLLAKYAFGGMTDGAVQMMNIQQSNLSSSSVNPTMFGEGGGVSSRTKVEVGDEKIAVIKNRKEVKGYPVYVTTQGYLPQTIGVFETKEQAEKKAMQIRKKNKYANGGGVEDEELHYWEVSLKMPNGEIVYESVIADSKEDAEYYGELTDSANEGAKVLSVKSMGKEKYANGGGVDAKDYRKLILKKFINKVGTNKDQFVTKYGTLNGDYENLRLSVNVNEITDRQKIDLKQWAEEVSEKEFLDQSNNGEYLDFDGLLDLSKESIISLNQILNREFNKNDYYFSYVLLPRGYDFYVEGISYAGGGGVDAEQEFVVTLQHSENGELLKFNVLGRDEENAIDNAYMEADLNQPYDVVNVKKYAKGGMTEHGLRVGDTIWGESKDLNQVFVKNNDEWKTINIDKGQRFAKGGNVSSMLRNRRGM